MAEVLNAIPGIIPRTKLREAINSFFDPTFREEDCFQLRMGARIHL